MAYAKYIRCAPHNNEITCRETTSRKRINPFHGLGKPRKKEIKDGLRTPCLPLRRTKAHLAGTGATAAAVLHLRYIG